METTVERSPVIIACAIFRDELRSMLPREVCENIIWIDAALHAKPALLEAALEETLGRCTAGGRNIAVFFGKGCVPDIDTILDRHGAKRFPFDNCIHALLGERRLRLDKERTIVFTPGWIRAWKSIMEMLGWDAVDVRMNLGFYDTILVLDSGMNSLSDIEILDFFDLTQIPIEIERLDMGHFNRAVNETLEQPPFFP